MKDALQEIGAHVDVTFSLPYAVALYAVESVESMSPHLAAYYLPPQPARYSFTPIRRERPLNLSMREPQLEKRILIIAGDFIEEYELMVPFQVLSAVEHAVYSLKGT